MDKGTLVYRAYVCETPGKYWIDKGTVSEIVADGVPLVRVHNVLTPLDDKWHTTRVTALGDVATALARQIGGLQAKLDMLRDEMLHESLTAEEVLA
jgi:hypothetical protein